MVMVKEEKAAQFLMWKKSFPCSLLGFQKATVFPSELSPLSDVPVVGRGSESSPMWVRHQIKFLFPSSQMDDSSSPNDRSAEEPTSQRPIPNIFFEFTKLPPQHPCQAFLPRPRQPRPLSSRGKGITAQGTTGTPKKK
ncbi:hypothetical protein CEXT_222491 [Caerostris extrusa]|uniref:Uncharacterized protein n=1 Tax=Caerostris extrusa TaxID=172846 RepID=A0AAV4NYQ6_CAEEX|nr:hypothetical protein CEXT_222491 [Caerostris extrusa]